MEPDQGRRCECTWCDAPSDDEVQRAVGLVRALDRITAEGWELTVVNKEGDIRRLAET